MKSGILATLLGLIPLIQHIAGNHLKVRHVCEQQHIDITQVSGVGLEANASSSVMLRGVKFPHTSFSVGDKITFEFRTTSKNGLIFHGQSHSSEHEISVYMQDGQVRLRIIGQCEWLSIRDVASDSYDIADNQFHTISILVKPTGLSFIVDHREERMFMSTLSPVFRCWHLQKFYFGTPSPHKREYTNQPELATRLDGCIRNFSSERSNGDDVELKTVYRRVSSCEDL